MQELVQAISLDSHEVTLHVGAVSDVGAKRAINEDSFLAGAPIFLVADGMGGHAHGDRASQTVARIFEAAIPTGKATTAAAVLSAISDSNAAVHALSGDHADETLVAGTTVSGVALVASEKQSSLHWMVFNVGDSRVYSWDGGLNQLTVDHSVVQELVDEGKITEREAAHHPERNVITRAIGVDEEVEPDIWLLPVGGRQVFLICSDGLTKELTDEVISDLVAGAVGAGAVAGLASTLVGMAIESGGLDNITVIVIEASMLAFGEGNDDEHAVGEVPAFLEQTLPRM